MKRLSLLAVISLVLGFAPVALYAGQKAGGKCPAAECGKKMQCKKADCPMGKKGVCKDPACNARYHKYHSKRSHRDNYHGNYFMDWADELKLTEKQITKLNKLRVDTKEKKMKLKKEKYELKAELRKESHKEKASRRQLKKLAMKIGKKKGKIMALRATALYDAKNILDDNQRKKLKEMFASYHKGLTGKEAGKKDK